MTLELPGKLIGGSIALATTSIGGVALQRSLDPITIGKEMQSKDKKTLLNSDYEHWNTLIQKYEASEKENNPKTIQDWKLPSSDKEEEKKSSLIKKCLELWNTKLDDVPKDTDKDRIKEDLNNWCVVDPQALKET